VQHQPEREPANPRADNYDVHSIPNINSLSPRAGRGLG
jgi:hypothetical protein